MASVASCAHPRASSPESQDLSLHLHEHAAIPLFRTGAQVVRRAASRSGLDACPGVDVPTVTARAHTQLSLLFAYGRTAGGRQIGRAHVWTSVTNAHLVWRLLLDKIKSIIHHTSKV